MSRPRGSTQPVSTSPARTTVTSHNWSQPPRTPDEQLTDDEWYAFLGVFRGQLPLPTLPTPTSRRSIAVKILENVTTAIQDLQNIEDHLASMLRNTGEPADGDWERTISEPFVLAVRAEKECLARFLENKAGGCLVYGDHGRVVVDADLEKLAREEDMTGGFARGAELVKLFKRVECDVLRRLIMRPGGLVIRLVDLLAGGR